MSILDRFEDWIVMKTMSPMPDGHPPSDDGLLTLLFFLGLLLVTGITCGHCIAR